MVDLHNLGQRISKGFDQAKQYASEKIGTADEVTSLSPEYLSLEEKTEQMKIIYENLIKVNRQFVNADNYAPPLQEQMIDVMGKLNEKLNMGVNTDNSGKDKSPNMGSSPHLKTIQHAASKAAQDGYLVLQPPDSMNEALKIYGESQEKIGNFRIEMDQKVQVKFLQPMQNIMDNVFAHVSKACKAAHGARLELDAIKTKCKGVSPEKLGSLQNELATAEEQFQANQRDAISRLTSVIENPQVIQCLSDLVEAQRKYHEQSFKALKEVTFTL